MTSTIGFCAQQSECAFVGAGQLFTNGIARNMWVNEGGMPVQIIIIIIMYLECHSVVEGV